MLKDVYTYADGRYDEIIPVKRIIDQNVALLSAMLNEEIKSAIFVNIEGNHVIELTCPLRVLYVVCDRDKYSLVSSMSREEHVGPEDFEGRFVQVLGMALQRPKPDDEPTWGLQFSTFPV